ncbi:hypothetical protein Cob_v000773 [Colletotrichum orbiculare MAFF 240422]|uniref:Uncharacterized protein n=1 Tax=Colletotrichum orbiculare (strain 104-T / ATCC 96160 / CBS 514.97 / LARS 414 / MAFF 240422) TaxID=1213857 RepID=A0A484G8A6_COLOR|nr:hypothetical protein Cob_v000773 [Colletotrichum orbiculare MAFF 240422]
MISFLHRCFGPGSWYGIIWHVERMKPWQVKGADLMKQQIASTLVEEPLAQIVDGGEHAHLRRSSYRSEHLTLLLAKLGGGSLDTDADTTSGCDWVLLQDQRQGQATLTTACGDVRSDLRPCCSQRAPLRPSHFTHTRHLFRRGDNNFSSQFSPGFSFRRVSQTT